LIYGETVITSKNDYKYYLERDKASLKVSGLKSYLFNEIWHFQRGLRRYEYHLNTKSFLRYFFRYLHERNSRKLGFSIPPNTFGPGLSIAHRGTIVINGKVRIGENCRIHVCVNIGAAATDSNSVPKIGDNCYIGPGAKLYGNISLGNNVSIGANSVVNKSFDNDCIIAGVPARVISDIKLKR